MGETKRVVLGKLALVVGIALLLISFVQLSINADTSPQTEAKQAESRIIIKDNVIRGSGWGIYLTWGVGRRREILILNNLITENGEGIRLVGISKPSFIVNNDLVNNIIGLKLTDRWEGKKYSVSAAPQLSHNNIYGNQEYGVLNLAPVNVNAFNNWWGSPQGPVKVDHSLKRASQTSTSQNGFIFPILNSSRAQLSEYDLSHSLDSMIAMEPYFSTQITNGGLAKLIKWFANPGLSFSLSVSIAELTNSNPQPILLYLPNLLEKKDAPKPAKIRGMIDIGPWLTAPAKSEKSNPNPDYNKGNPGQNKSQKQAPNPQTASNQLEDNSQDLLSEENQTPNQVVTNPPTKLNLNAQLITHDSYHMVQFFANTAPNANRGITSYEWKFGDGGSSSLATPVHNYPSCGIYTVELTLKFQDGGTQRISRKLSVQGNRVRFIKNEGMNHESE